jgi:hypothetical protein
MPVQAPALAICPGAPQKSRIDAGAGAGAVVSADITPKQLDFASDDVPSIGEDGLQVSIGPHFLVSIDMHSSRQTSAPEQNGPTVSFASALKALNVPAHI